LDKTPNPEKLQKKCLQLNVLAVAETLYSNSANAVKRNSVQNVLKNIRISDHSKEPELTILYQTELGRTAECREDHPYI